MLANIYYILIFFIEIIGILSAVHAIFYSRTPQGSTAWAFSLIFLAPIAVPCYAVFGRNKFRGYVRRFQNHKLTIQKRLSNLILDTGYPLTDFPIAMRVPLHLAQFQIMSGNKLTILADADSMFTELFEQIKTAKKYILVQYYTVFNDQLGVKFQTALIEAVQKGVRVYFIYDRVGSYSLPNSYVQKLIDAGVEVSVFRSSKDSIVNPYQVNFRNHRKLLLVDGIKAITGGHNIGDRYEGKHPRITPWRDTSVLIKGPAVLALQFCFLEDWYWSEKKLDPNLLSWNFLKQGDEKALVVPTGPADKFESGSLLVANFIHASRERIWISTPYLVLDSANLLALQSAAIRGVDVRIIIPGVADRWVVSKAAGAFYEDLLEAGVKLYYYPGFMHQKALLVDDRYACIGTHNLDNRSFRLNFEAMIVAMEGETTQNLAKILEVDLSISKPIKLSEVKNRSWLEMFLVRFARLFAPIL